MAPLSEAATFNQCSAESDGNRLFMKFYMSTASQRLFSQTTRRERRVEPTAAACTSRPSAAHAFVRFAAFACVVAQP